MQEKDAIYLKEDSFSEAWMYRHQSWKKNLQRWTGGMQSHLRLTSYLGIGIAESEHYKMVKELDGNQKVRVLWHKLYLAILMY
ncbi:MAG: hypothetical protein U0T36_09100 [Saprospiraceae bacterium]